MRVPSLPTRSVMCTVPCRIAAFSIVLLLAVSAHAQDRQFTAPGNGFVNPGGFDSPQCVLPGVNLFLDSTAGGDDVVAANNVFTGPNGICQTLPAGDDVHPPNGVVFGRGLPNAAVVIPGPTAAGICQDVVTALGDDVVRVTAGRSRPGMIGVGPGVNGTLESTALGDDVATGVVCPGTDGTFETTPNAADVFQAVDVLCDLCAQTVGCIVPGTDGILQTTAAPTDLVAPFISTGADGIAASASVGTDVQVIPVGQGFAATVCVDAGANGIAETTLCGNGVDDVDENGVLPSTGECDDGNQASGDGCAGPALGVSPAGAPGCLVETGWTCSGAPSACAPICGDALVRGTEGCDDGNQQNRDDCLATCVVATCGDGFLHNLGTGTEVCDDGNLVNGDGCDANCRPTGCGNNVVNAGETCDDGNLVNGDGCDANCTPTGCGNGITTAGEQCDDGNASNVDDCRVGCLLAACGDGVLRTGGTPPFEQCDDSNAISGDGCDANCTPTGCGNGITTAGEACDDGNAVQTDNCLPTCALASCGDGFTKTSGTGPFEQCDDGNVVNGDGCDVNCTPSGCGNGVVGGAETCDDGNVASGDGCDANCTPTGCGNAVVTAGEACDDGNAVQTDNCLVTCVLAACGDGFTKTSGAAPFEQCDDNNTISGDGCDANCKPTGCPNGIVTAGETCDDGDTQNGDGCDNNCTPTGCGNGVVTQGEQCDDGNVTSGDGCDANCEPTGCGNGVVTVGEQCDDGNTRNDDACVQGCLDAVCGDGFKRRTVEECDDGNVLDGDGCSALCVREIPPRCGDRVIEAPEECDDGNASDRDDCTRGCKLAVCGDGFVHDKGAGTEACDDDNVAAGDGCSPTCTLECGNGVIDGGCTQGTVGAPCADDAGCDTMLGAGDGICRLEPCDPGAAALCQPGPTVCSNVCLIASCGNEAVECDEECDLGLGNGVPGTGCTAACKRNLVGADELTGGKECPGAFTMDSPPQDLGVRRQTCADGASCDFDGVANGRCAFRVGFCLNRPSPASCAAAAKPIAAVDLIGVKLGGRCTAGRLNKSCGTNEDCDTAPAAADGDCADRDADAAAALTQAIVGLAPDGAASVPDRCRAGLRRKVCSIPDDNECDRSFGKGDGLCDIGAGVEFLPPLTALAQGIGCTEGVDVIVDVGSKLKLRAHVRDASGKADKDRLMLVCE